MNQMTTIQEKLFSSFDRFSENIAVDVENNKITYQALKQGFTSIGQFFSNQPIVEGSDKERPVVGLLLSRRSDVIQAVLGALFGRCIFVVFDPAHPVKRLQLLVENLELDHLITDADLLPLAKQITIEKTKLHLIEEITSEDHSSIADFSMPAYHLEDSIYVYYTSGSTGTPKGIEGKNSSLVQFLNWEISTFEISEADRFSQFISPVFDAFLRDILVPLLSGATICIPNEQGELKTPEETTSWLEEKQVNVVHCVPSIFNTFVGDHLSSESYPDLRLILMSGEKIVPHSLSPWYTLFGERIQLVNFYGTTETTMIRAYYPIQPSDQDKVRIPVGKAIDDTQLLVLDQHKNPVDRLITGDLYIASEYMTKGYWNNPEANAEAFLSLQLEDDSEVWAFKTGDKARWLSNGNLELLGRDDNQVKVLGTRIELDEIELQILKLDEVKEALVLVNQTNGVDRICAFITPPAGQTVSEELEQLTLTQLKTVLPPYMCPSVVKAVDQFSLLSSGKIDRKSLLQSLVEREVIAPANELEEQILGLWQELLSEKVISTDESFLKVGGNSISLMKLIGRIYRALKVKIGLAELFSNLTIQAQAQFVQNATRNNHFNISPAASKTSYNLSSVQERLYFESEREPSSKAYNIPTAWQVTRDYDLQKITEVINEITRRHESLRTVFKMVNGRPQQIVEDEFVWDVKEEDISGRDFSEVFKEFIQPFDLSKPPLARCKVVSDAEGKKTLLLDIHHIVCDGRSQQTIVNNFEKLYRDEAYPSPKFQYKDFAEWESNFVNSDAYLEQREFWLKKFEEDIPELAVHAVHDIDDNTDRGGLTQVSMDSTAINSVAEELSEFRLTSFSVTLAMYHLFMADLTGQDDIVIGIVSEGRTQAELEGVVGMFVKNLPMRTKIDLHSSFATFVSEVHKDFLACHNHQAYDLSNIMSELNKHHQGQVAPLFQTSIDYVKINIDEMDDWEEPLFKNVIERKKGAKYPLVLLVTENDDHFDFGFEYFRNYFTDEDMRILANRFLEIVQRTADNPHAKLSEIIGNEEESQMVESENEDISFEF